MASDLFSWNNQGFVIVVDYYSKYWEIDRLYDTKSIAIVKKMKKMFSRLAISETLQNDNGPQYTAQLFKEFSKEWNFKHVTSSLEYPRSNDFVERHIQIVKNLLTKAKQSGKDPYLTMLESRNCPVENSGSPPQLIYGRCLRSLLPIYQEKSKIKSINDDDIHDEKVQKQSKQAFYYHEQSKCQKQLKEGQDVILARCYNLYLLYNMLL